MYLFGKVIPAFSLLLSMTLRFVPRFTEQIKRVAEAQQCIGRNVNNGNIFQRAAHGLKILSITTTWALENSVETADSMKSPGLTGFAGGRISVSTGLTGGTGCYWHFYWEYLEHCYSACTFEN